MIVATTLSAAILLSTFATERFGGLYGPEETAKIVFRLENREPGRKGNFTAGVCIKDAFGNVLVKRLLTAQELDTGRISVTRAELGGKFGAFTVGFSAKEQGGDKCKAETTFAFLTSNTVKPAHWVGTGLHSSHGWGVGDYRYVDVMATAGIGCVRDEVYWSSCEKKRGVYAMPEKFDRFVDALCAKGIKLNLLLNYTNNVYDDPADPEAFSKWAVWIGKTLAGRVDRFEIWNEPGNFYFKQRYGGDRGGKSPWVRKFVEFTRTVDDHLHAARPDALISVCSEDYMPALEAMLELGIAKPHNAIAFHPYCHSQIRPEREMWFKDDGRRLRELMAANGGATKTVISEMGWTTYEGKMSFMTVAGGYPRSSFLHQAQYFIRMYVAARQTGVEFICQYDFKNDGSVRSYTEHNFGMVHEDYGPKPGLAAVAQLVRLVGEAEPKGDLSFAPDKFRLYRFRRNGDTDLFCAWSVENEYDFELPPKQRTEAIKALDIFGNPVKVPIDRRRLKLSETPLWLTGLDVASLLGFPRISVRVVDDHPVIGEEMLLKVAIDADSWRWLTYRDSSIALTLKAANGFVSEHSINFSPIRPFNAHTPNVYRRNGKFVAPVRISANTLAITSVTVTASSPLLSKPKTATFPITKGVPVDWDVEVDRAPNGVEDVALDCTFSDGRTLHEVRQVRNATIQRASVKPSFSGKWDDEWLKQSPLLAEPVYAAQPGCKWAGKNDLWMEARACYDDQGFYVGVKVHDDVFFQPYTNWDDTEKGDSLQVGFSRELTSRREEVIVSRFPDRTVCVENSSFNESKEPYRVKYTPITDNDGVYEVFMPWSRSRRNISEQKLMKLSIFFNDNDGEGPKGGLEIHSGIGRNRSQGIGLYGVYSLD